MTTPECHVVVSGTGIHARVDRISDRLDRAVELAARSGDHVWIVIVTHLVSEATLKAMADEPLHLDTESLAGSHIGCYVCEQGYSPRLLRRRCPGEPK